MKSRLSMWTLAVVFVLASKLANADLYIIAHPATAVSAGDIRDLFAGNKQLSGITLVDNVAAQDSFLMRVLRLDASRYNTLWTKKIFREGLMPPALTASDDQTVAYVRHKIGAVSYVASPPPPDVAIVYILRKL